MYYGSGGPERNPAMEAGFTVFQLLTIVTNTCLVGVFMIHWRIFIFIFYSEHLLEGQSTPILQASWKVTTYPNAYWVFPI